MSALVWAVGAHLFLHPTQSLQAQGTADCTLTVTTTADSGPGSLRAAIECANSTPGLDIITFNIPGEGPRTLTPLSALPSIRQPLIIDGYSQPGSSSNTLAQGHNAVLLIELNGASAGPGVEGLEITAGNSIVRGLVINNFSRNGIVLDSDGNVVEGNFVGTSTSGGAPSGNSRGIEVDGSNNRIGGTSAGARNLISGNTGNGIEITGGSGNLVQGNFIGTDSSGARELGNAADGLNLDFGSNTTVGGSAEGGNTIAFNGRAGVFVDSGTGHAIRANSIFSNTDLGIVLGSGGIVPNDPGDPDSGDNNLQNYPVLTSATREGALATVQGTLNSRPGTSFTIELFSNSECDPSGFGEGKTFLVSRLVTTDGNGDASFSISAPLAEPSDFGPVVTATATDPEGNTSEFSQCLQVQATPACSLAVTSTADGGPGSLREAIICANHTPGPDTITLPPGTYTLTLSGAGENAAATGDLDITDSLTILGADAANTIIDGNHLDRIFDVQPGTNHLALSGLTLRQGQPEANASGGAIKSESMGDITIAHCLINDNTSPSSGGGIFVLRGNGNLTINDSTFVNNQSGNRDGGAIFYDTPGGALRVTRCRFENNRASGDGGAIEFIPPRANDTRIFNIADSVFINNQSGTGPNGGEGGAVYVCCSTIDTVITGSTFAGNSTADDGGAIYTCCTGSTLISITNTTFSANSATKTSGGAIEAEGPVTLVNVTLSGNRAPRGGAIWNDDDRSVTLLNTIIADSPTNNLDGRIFVSLGHNLSSDNSGAAWLTAPGDQNNVNPRLGPLSDNGGTTQTHLPLTGSPAIDAGDQNGAPDVDQRGIKRPQGASIDIGAVEGIPACSLAVTTTADGGPGSLREAIICANNKPGPDTITLPPGTYTLTLSGANEDAAATGDLDIADSLTILGAGATNTIIDGNHLDRIFDVRPGTNHLALSGLTLRHGQSEARASGGAIRSDAAGHLTIDHCLISDNSSGSAGGAIDLSGDGSLTLTDSTLANNQSARGEDGGGIFLNDSPIGGLEVTRCRFENNVTPSSGGGAIAFVSLSPGDSGIFTITDSVFINNQSGPGTTDGAGGALYVLVRTGATTIVRTTFSGNSSGGDGGAIYNRGTNIIISSTFTGNSAGTDGGAIHTCCNASSLLATNNTFSANSASRSGGAIQAEGPVTLVNVTISGNTAQKGGGIWNDNNLTVRLLNTIIDHSATNNLEGGTFVSLGHNLSSDNSGIAWLTASGDRNNTDPRLGPLSDNGGPTQTHALLSGSPAIDAGQNNGAPDVDQRGIARPQGGGVDIGAFEGGGAAPAAANLSLTLRDSPDPVTVSNQVTFTITVSNAGPARATSVIVTNTLPPGAVATAVSGDSTQANGRIIFRVGALASAATARLTFVIRPLSPGTLTNLAAVSAAETDPNPANNFAMEVTTVSPAPVAKSDLVVEVADRPDPVAVGSSLAYTLTVRNDGPDLATDVTLTDTLPAGVDFVSATGGGQREGSRLSFSIGQVASGESVTRRIEVRPTIEGVITNTASVTGGQIDPKPENNAAAQTTTVITAPAVTLQLLSPITLNPQTGLFEQTVRFNNLSSSEITGVRINIQGLPADVVVYNASGSAEGGAFVQYDLPVPAGGSVDFVIEFYRGSRELFRNPDYAAEVVSPLPPSTSSGEVLGLDRKPLIVNGRLLIEFKSIPGRRYRIEYSSDLSSWKSATPGVRAAGNRVQWLDDGPPKTESKPSQAGTRFYRVVLLP